MFKRTLILLYGIICYFVFFGTFLYAVGFIGGFLAPTTLDGEPGLPLPAAVAVDLGLLSLFAVQHSVMARPFFKRWITRWLPRPAERSTYVLFSSLALILLFVYWQPLGGVLWSVEASWARTVLLAVFALGWLIVLVSTFLINHFDLFGLRQAWTAFRGRQYEPLTFVTPAPYRIVRHPIYVGFLLAFWAAPVMTAAHFLFALMTTLYILVGIQLEERDLMNAHPEYRQYRSRVPMLIPGWAGRARVKPKAGTPLAG